MFFAASIVFRYSRAGFKVRVKAIGTKALDRRPCLEGGFNIFPGTVHRLGLEGWYYR